MQENIESRAGDTAEADLLRGGPRDMLLDFDRAYRVFHDMVGSFRKLNDLGPAVTVYGSARLQEGHGYYELARAMGRELATAGFSVITGGGPGIMEAANRGAKEANGHSLGFNIVLPHEQHVNRWVDVTLTFEYFFVRKLMLRRYSQGFVLMPGGLGTLDEIFETATLIQTGKIGRFPIVLMGTDYWEPIAKSLRDVMSAAATVSHGDFQSLHTDDPAEAVAYLKENAPPPGDRDTH